jgi:hypothetical protein
VFFSSRLKPARKIDCRGCDNTIVIQSLADIGERPACAEMLIEMVVP